ncbi:VanZ family protein [Bacillus changyiensis]|uniref:VanZ family protein n=1 Tax=Bacillus changyiensis TaxID=3004103 RepID=UPI0022E5B1B9|nr:VanZ family protein [Bacillus changyiensis]MDA1477177.1 VanZ family protein [Bacillus changyiensis]
MVYLGKVGFVFVLLYFVYDLIKHRKQTSFFRKVIFASFLVFLCGVFHYTIGGIYVPPQKEFARLIVQLIPFYFVSDWVKMYQQGGFDFFFWNAVKLTALNVLLLFPLGVYLRILWKETTFKKALLLSFLTSLIIESLQLGFSALGLIEARSFDVDDLMLNTFGSMFGFSLCRYVLSLLPKKRSYHTSSRW